MAKIISIVLLSTLLSFTANAQPSIYDGMPYDSTTFTFQTFDSLKHSKEFIDTTNTMLWEIGTTSKTFFSPNGPDSSISIITDTANTYPVNANDWFTLHLNKLNLNTIVSFWHKYQTTKGRDGGIIEFSYDGNTWLNILDSCHSGQSLMPGVITSNTYTKKDTLLNGQWAFSGESNGWQYSRIQFFVAVPVKSTAGWNCTPKDSIKIRFGFVSDDTSESLDGWMIGDIKVEHDMYWGSVAETTKSTTLTIYPNPSTGIITFPNLPYNNKRILSLQNSVGQHILTMPYQSNLNLNGYPKGLYTFRVMDTDGSYTGKFLLE